MEPIDCRYKGRIFTLFLVGLIFVCVLLTNTLLVRADLPAGLEEGSYAKYEQAFSIGETHILYWQVMSLTTTNAEIKIISHGVQFNVSTMRFSTVLGGGYVTIDQNTAEILQYRHLNGTVMPNAMVGQKLAFWISTDIDETSLIENIYDQNVHPTLTGPLQFDCLPAPRLCWLTENTYSPDNTMSRYYDTATGIVLKICTYICVADHHVSVMETLNDTNIAALQTVPIPSNLLIILGIGAASITVACIVLVIIWHRRKR